VYKLLIKSQKNTKSVWLTLDCLNKTTYKKELKKVFKDDKELYIADYKNVPFEFRHAGIVNAIIPDRFWDWKDYSKEDQDLLIKYIEYSQDDESTLKQAKMFVKAHGGKFPDLKEFKRQRFLNSIL